MKKMVALVSNDLMIGKIFALVAKRLAFEYEQFSSLENVDTDYDYLIIDDKIDINKDLLKFFTTKIILTGSTQALQEYDHTIVKPFLPSDLQKSLEKIFSLEPSKVNNIELENQSVSEVVEEQNSAETIEDISHEDLSVDTSDLSAFVDTIVSDMDNEEDGEELLTIKKENLSHGGVLDKNELSRLYNMLGENIEKFDSIDEKDSEDWVELSKIIDKAIDDIESYEYEEDKPIKLILNQYTMDQLAPLLKMLNQEIIDDLTDGKDIHLHLRLEK